MAGAQPQAAQSPARFQLARLAAPCLLGFAAVNLLVWLWVRTADLEAQPVDLQTRLVYRLRLDSFFASSPKPRAVFVGDSFVHGAHLRVRQGARWPEHTLPAQFASRATPMAALNLGVDGLLFSELSCIVHDVLAQEPEYLVIVISPRPLAADLARPDAESARPFLCPAAAAAPAAREWLGELAYRSIPVHRYRDLLQLHYLDTTPRAFLIGQLMPRLSAPEEPADPDEQQVLARTMQRMRAAQRLASVELDLAHPQARALEQLLTVLQQQTQTRVLVVYLRENLSELAGTLDVARYEAVAQRFSEWVRAQLTAAKRSRFIVEPAEHYAGEFTDHIHLTSHGYSKLAARLSAELPP